MKQDFGGVIGVIVIVLILALSIGMSCRRYNECRTHFSVLYCLESK